MRTFFNCRSKILFLVAFISLIIFILCIPTLIDASHDLSLIKPTFPVDTEISSELNVNIVLNILNNQFWFTHITIFSIFAFSIIMISAFLNVAGYIIKKNELNVISIGLITVVIFSSVYMFDLVGLILLALFFILNVLGYIDQIRINNKQKDKQ